MERRRVSFREVAYDYRTTLRKLRAAKLVAQVTLEPPQGVWRRVERYKARWARYWAERAIMRLSLWFLIGVLALGGLLLTRWGVDSAAAPASGGPAFQGQLRSPIGTNLELLAYWSPQVPFVDVMKSSSEWLSGDAKDWGGGPPLDLDANGWVRSLRPGQVARKLMLREFGDRYPGGRYLVRYKGEGKLNFGFAAKVVSQRRGEMVIEVTPNDGGVYVWIDATNPANYLREIEILMPGGICEGDPFTHVASARDCGSRRYLSFADNPDILFYPVFAERLRGYSVLRFMDWMHTNSSPVATWAQRTPLGLQHLGDGARGAGRSDDRARQPGGRAPVVHAAAPERRGLRAQPCADGQGEARPGAGRVRGALERGVELACSRSTRTFRSRRRR